MRLLIVGEAILAPPEHALATIPVAEDDSSLRTSIGDLPLTNGYKVLLAVDGFSALRLATAHFPDMLVSDVGMPGMDGLEFSRRFRDLPGNRVAPTSLLTALREPILEPFFTTKDQGAGTGLGLPTFRQIFEQHQGTLRVVDGNRSTFRIDIPLTGASNVSASSDAVPQRKQASL
ncbi:MAG: response regulator [Clostridia bacterium]|nr:response regulator [Deltaproteobacteria bacterium]